MDAANNPKIAQTKELLREGDEEQISAVLGFDPDNLDVTDEATHQHVGDAIGLAEDLRELIKGHNPAIIAGFTIARAVVQLSEEVRRVGSYAKVIAVAQRRQNAEVAHLLESIDTNLAELAGSADSIDNSLDTIATFSGMGEAVSSVPANNKRGA